MYLIENQRYVASLGAMLSRLDLGFLRGQRILVTGASGMLGSCLIDALMLWNRNQEKPCHIVAVGRSEAAAKERFVFFESDEHFTFCRQDICEPLAELPEWTDYIIHAASNADPINMAQHPIDTLMANVAGTHNLMDYGVEHGMKRFLYVSSGEFYGQPDVDTDSFSEAFCGRLDYTSPRSCYPAGKRAAEVLCQSFISQRGADVVIVRPCHLFGPTMKKQDSRAVSEFLQSASEGRDICLHSDGLKERSHCYVIDAVSALLLVLRDGVCGQAYNIADPGYQMTIRTFAEEAAKAGRCQVVFKEPDPVLSSGYSRVSRAVLNAERLRALGWNTMERTTSAIEETVKILSDLACSKREDLSF